uniref:Endo/exonuclease/phosphatase domain-containing protein n=1 Tax=Haemonchus contortus TaxID=6289 RepID=A0A7I5EDS0_HAECO
MCIECCGDQVRRHGLTETRMHRPLHAVFETGEELFLGTCDSRGVGGVGVLVSTHLAMNIDSYERLTTRIGRLRSRRRGSIPALTIFVAYAPTSSYEEEDLEAFYMDLERLYREEHFFFKIIVGDFNAEIGPRRTAEELHIGTHEWIGLSKTSINWDHFASLASQWEDSVIDNIDEKYNRLVEHLHDSATKAESLQVAKRRLSSKTLELIHQRGIARATGNYQQRPNLRSREAIKEDLKERRAAVMDEVARGRKEHSQSPTELLQLQDQDDLPSSS